jgi:tetrahydromethanopterin S-methyltransferase subunit G
MEMEERFDKIDKNMESLHKDVLSFVGATNKAVEDLTYAVAQGFAKVEERFEKIGERFEKIDLQFEQTNGKIDGINRRIDNEADQRVELGLRVENGLTINRRHARARILMRAFFFCIFEQTRLAVIHSFARRLFFKDFRTFGRIFYFISERFYSITQLV